MDQNSIFNFNIIKKLQNYKKQNSLTNEDLEEKLTDIALDLFENSKKYWNWWTAKKVGQILRGERSISNIADRKTISVLLTQNPDSYPNLIFSSKSDVIKFLTFLLKDLEKDLLTNKELNSHINKILSSNLENYIQALNKIRSKNAKVFDYKTIMILEILRSNPTYKEQYNKNNFNTLINNAFDFKTLKITSQDLQEFRSALPTEGTSLAKLKITGYKFLISNLIGIKFK